MINSHNIWKECLLCFCLLTAHSVEAQSLQRKVFSPAGSVFSHNGQEYGFTIGEPMIGTDLLTIPYLTKGFQQPEPLYLLAPSLTLHNVTLEEDQIALHWSSSHYQQASHYEIEVAIGSGGFVFQEMVSSSGTSTESVRTKSPVAIGQTFSCRVLQKLTSGEVVTSNVIEMVLQDKTSNWRVQPNPVTSQTAFLTFSGSVEGEVSVEIFTQVGQSLGKEQYWMTGENELPITLNNLPSAIYLVKIEHPDYQGIRRVIVKR